MMKLSSFQLQQSYCKSQENKAFHILANLEVLRRSCTEFRYIHLTNSADVIFLEISLRIKWRFESNYRMDGRIVFC